MPNPTQIATIVANGETYDSWTSVEIERSFGTAVSYLTLVCSELSRPSAFKNLKLGPGDQVQGFLADVLAITGKVDERQTFYDSKNHIVQVKVASRTLELTATTVDGAPGQYQNYNLQQIARAVAQKVGVNIILKGSPAGADKIFERVSEHVGQTRFDFLELLARWRNLHMVDDENGNLIFARPSSGEAFAALVEGQNILNARLHLIDHEAISQTTINTALHGNDDHWGDDARNITATVQNPNYSGPRNMVIAGELNEDQQGAQMRAQHEMNLSNQGICDALVTVQGWLLEDGSLWIQHLGETITLDSPMLFPKDITFATLKLKGVKHKQNNTDGSITELSLCLEGGLGVNPQVNLGIPGATN